MANLVSPRRPGAAILSEAGGHRSREDAVVAVSQTVLSGSVLALTSGGEYALYDNGGAAPLNTAVAVAIYPITTDGANTGKIAVIRRDAEVKLAELDFNGQAQPAIDAGVVDLAAAGIIVR